MNDILQYTQWEALHLDGVVILLVICAGFWQKKYLSHITISDAWKTLIVSFVFTTIYILLIWATTGSVKNKLIDYFLSFGITTSLYDLILKPVIQKFFPTKDSN